MLFNLILSFVIKYSKEKGIYEDSLKTEASIRIVSIPEKAMKLVKKLVTENKKNKPKLGNKWTDTDYLLTQEPRFDN